jgi:hypothetical protein
MEVAALQGAYASRRGDFADAEQHFLQARSQAAQIPDSLHKFMLYARLGVDALNRGDTQDGPRNFLLALDSPSASAAPRTGSTACRTWRRRRSMTWAMMKTPSLLVEALDIIGTQKLKYQQTIVRPTWPCVY